MMLKINPDRANGSFLTDLVRSNVFFDFNGIVYHGFLPPGRMVLMRSTVWKFSAPNVKQSEENTTVHTSLLISKFLAKKDTVIMPQPSYSPT